MEHSDAVALSNQCRAHVVRCSGGCKPCRPVHPDSSNSLAIDVLTPSPNKRQDDDLFAARAALARLAQVQTHTDVAASDKRILDAVNRLLEVTMPRRLCDHMPATRCLWHSHAACVWAMTHDA